MWPLSTLAVLFTLGAVSATPLTPSTLSKREASPVSIADLAGYAPYTQFAMAAYCPTRKLAGWKCGSSCFLHSFFFILQLNFICYDQELVKLSQVSSLP